MDNLQRLRESELELLDAFIDVCQRESLNWYAMSGTLLGAVRDGGFLLWDDDIDIAMPTEDYRCLCSHKEWFDERYFLQTPQDDGISTGAKLRKNGTTAFCKPLRESLLCGGHHGVCIDIMQLYDVYNSGYYALASGAVYPKALFGDVQKLPFEHLQINVPQKYREVLTLTYGYWNWPGGAEFVSPHYWFYDTGCDYLEYVRKYTGWPKDIEGKSIYLFGAGDSLRIWLRDFGHPNQIVCTFDNDSAKWGEVAYGIKVKDPAQAPQLLDINSRLIVTSIWHREIGAQLEEMGIRDYYVFLDGLFNVSRRPS